MIEIIIWGIVYLVSLTLSLLTLWTRLVGKEEMKLDELVFMGFPFLNFLTVFAFLVVKTLDFLSKKIEKITAKVKESRPTYKKFTA